VSRPFVIIGATSITAGGVVAAATRPLAIELGSWLAAFLVLVAGVAQLALGVGQGWFAATAPPVRRVTAEVTAWNAGAGLTVAGTLTERPIVTSVGAAAVVTALVLFLRTTRGGGVRPAWLANVYRGVITVVLVSTPIGQVLAWTRH
jgi:hypothetical protein